MKVGVILRSRAREKDVELMKKFFDVVVFKIPEDLPELIENPSEYLNLPEEFLEADMFVSYAGHPDINLELLKKLSNKLVIFSGGAKAGSYVQLKKEGEKRGIKVVWEEICCATPEIDDKRYREFFKHFGKPEVEVKLEGDRVAEVEVKRSAFCGATYFVAEKIKGLDVNEAPSKAGYYTQIFPCYATRGIEGGIHKAARVHKRAVEKAIQRARERTE
ncbi:Uncharacterized protein conserved in archaea [Archaeoglobus sulfaticallidus PM70-1]|uniref:Uncharacterized protein conserved in archaea n=1 Tax=Archaeoglobus sulfaticallidus PM70-1 TaxID=387631 RepID=N0BJ44_9EURY|nr:DUF166 family protein [Archaeoglobus sulfaticallidus]AGK60481.1 Uncharacterized protein conserved in archaea [Archaeoglobus sulfaticallidus PM70-1]